MINEIKSRVSFTFVDEVSKGFPIPILAG